MTGIEWTDTTWNPTTGCDRVSPGCDNCYALTLAKRLKGMGQAKYQRDGDPRTSGPGFGITEHPDVLTEPFRWRKPRKVFVNSMSDLFHDGVSDEFIARAWAVMAATPQHTYQVLTKRHGRMRSLLNSENFAELVAVEMAAIWQAGRVAPLRGPLPNVWVGVSVEDQKRADLRIPALLGTPAAVRFLSCEPLLGPVDLSGWLSMLDLPKCWDDHSPSSECAQCIRPTWVIVGGESGPGSRPMHPDWARSLRDQCESAGVAFFFKQWGQWAPDEHDGAGWDMRPGRHVFITPDGKCTPGPAFGSASTAMRAVPKKGEHRELDGRCWDEFPPAVSG